METSVLPKMIVLTAPSGAGKTTIVKHLLEKFSFLDFSVSATSRTKRENEIHGKDYYYISSVEFKSAIEKGDFIEWEEVRLDQYYGTLKSEIDRIWKNGKTVVFDINVESAINIKKIYSEKCLSIFVKPPSIEILNRLKNRNSGSEDSFQKSIEEVKKEMTFENQFDAVIVNDLLVVASKEAEYLVENFVLGYPFNVFEEQ